MLNELIDEWLLVGWSQLKAWLPMALDAQAGSMLETWQWLAPLVAGCALIAWLAWVFKRNAPRLPDSVSLLLPGHAELIGSPLVTPLDRDLRALADWPGIDHLLRTLRAGHYPRRRLRLPARALGGMLAGLRGVERRGQLAMLLEDTQRRRTLQAGLAKLGDAAWGPAQSRRGARCLREGHYAELAGLLATLAGPESAEAAALRECAADSAALAGERERAGQYLEDALEARLSGGDLPGCIGVMSRALWLQRRAGTAQSLIDECERWVNLMRSLADMRDGDAARFCLAQCCLQLGDACYLAKRREPARRAYDETLARLSQRLDSPAPRSLLAALAHQRLALTADTPEQGRLHAGAALRLIKDSPMARNELGADLLASAQQLAR